jgi:hypothetical protein
LNNDVAKLITLLEEFAHSMLGQHFRLDKQANPATGLAQLLKTDAKACE